VAQSSHSAPRANPSRGKFQATVPNSAGDAERFVDWQIHRLTLYRGLGDRNSGIQNLREVPPSA